VKPWERALQREPMCAFVEAIVDGYAPLDKHICKLARAGAAMRDSSWWDKVPPTTGGYAHLRGEKTWWTRSVYRANTMAGEIPWK
jgi:hypothetical protein